jgi:GDP-L-fucose synthase
MAVDDLADACVFVIERYSGVETLNIGTGEEISIADFARLIAEIVGYRGRILFDPSRPDGTPRKLLDVSRVARLGWQPKTTLRDGLESYYAAFLAND